MVSIIMSTVSRRVNRAIVGTLEYLPLGGKRPQ